MERKLNFIKKGYSELSIEDQAKMLQFMTLNNRLSASLKFNISYTKAKEFRFRYENDDDYARQIDELIDETV